MVFRPNLRRLSRTASRRSPCMSISPPRALPPVPSDFLRCAAIRPTPSSSIENPLMIVAVLPPRPLRSISMTRRPRWLSTAIDRGSPAGVGAWVLAVSSSDACSSGVSVCNCDKASFQSMWLCQSVCGSSVRHESGSSSPRTTCISIFTCRVSS